LADKAKVIENKEGAKPASILNSRWFKQHKLSLSILGLIALLIIGLVLWREVFYKPYTPPPPNTKLTYAQLVSQVNQLEQEKRYNDALTLLNSQAVSNNTTTANTTDNSKFPLLDVLSLKAGVYVDQKNYSQAIATYEKINQQYGENPSVDDTIAHLALQNGDKNTAKTYYNKELQLLQNEPTQLPGIKGQINNVQTELSQIK